MGGLFSCRRVRLGGVGGKIKREISQGEEAGKEIAGSYKTYVDGGLRVWLS